MSDKSTAQLVYPHDKVPGYGEAIEVAPGIYWSRLPLPFKLDHINVWLLQDEEGLSLIDTGIQGAEAERLLAKLIDELAGEAGLSRVYVTHMHPDHVGMAGRLVDRWDAAFWMTRQEYLTARVLSAQAGDERVPPTIAHFFRQAGWSPVAVEDYLSWHGSYGRSIAPLPLAYHRLEEGQLHRIGGYEWRVVLGRGHSPEHACFYNEQLKLLISGDQVLPRISPNVSVSPMEPLDNPMADWLSSLWKLKSEVSEDVLVLPAHQECFRGLHSRLDQLIGEHQNSFATLLETLQSPQRVVDVFPVLFSRPISDHDIAILSLATGEAVACLNYLLSLGKISRKVDAQGVAWYQVA